LVSAFAVASWGWQYGFWVASFFLIFRGITLYLSKPKNEFKPKNTVKKQVKTTFTLPIVLSGFALMVLNMVRYGVLTWFFVYMVQQSNLTIPQFFGKDVVALALIPIAGICGTLIYNKLPWKKDLTSIAFLTAMGITWLIFPFVSGLTAIIFLLASSAFLYGPHVFLVCTLPSRYKKDGVVASSTGFIDGMGYVGTFMIGLLVPFIVIDAGGWSNVFLFWASLSFIGALIVAVTYKISPTNRSGTYG